MLMAVLTLSATRYQAVTANRIRPNGSSPPLDCAVGLVLCTASCQRILLLSCFVTSWQPALDWLQVLGKRDVHVGLQDKLTTAQFQALWSMLGLDLSPNYVMAIFNKYGQDAHGRMPILVGAAATHRCSFATSATFRHSSMQHNSGCLGLQAWGTTWTWFLPLMSSDRGAHSLHLTEVLFFF
jgi:hypothetical protein